jgi:3-oxoacyl-[acyl-carrier protein] reductase
MNINLSGKTALVCGSTQGIGKATAIELAKLGANVTLIARNEAKLQILQQELDIIERKQQHTFLIADFSNPQTLHEIIKSYVETQQEIHILVNNTGGPPAGLAIEAETGEFIEAFNSHLICNHVLVQAVVPLMKKAGYGRIVNIISTSVKQPIPGLGVSNTIRAAVANWAKTLSLELAPYGITVNNVLPGSTRTSRLYNMIENRAKKVNVTVEEMEQKLQMEIPVRRFASPEEIAAAVAFLCTPSAAYINGINLPVDGGKTGNL